MNIVLVDGADELNAHWCRVVHSELPAPILHDAADPADASDGDARLGTHVERGKPRRSLPAVPAESAKVDNLERASASYSA